MVFLLWFSLISIQFKVINAVGMILIQGKPDRVLCSKPLGGLCASGSVSQSVKFIHGCVWLILRVWGGTSYIYILYTEKT